MGEKRRLSEDETGTSNKRLEQDVEALSDSGEFEVSSSYESSDEQIFDTSMVSGAGGSAGRQLTPAGNNQWQETITKVVKSVVSIQFTHVTTFDTESALVSEATGFVVDAERGLILTNRHVVGPGPFCGYAVFDNHEEAVLKPIYRDPIHDFGFLQFDPKDIKYMEVSQLELRPNLAQVGTEIRVVGNDNGEKLSILAGFISRLDRNAPDYGMHTYNDFNTEYIQAAASASGGSSGSPVVNMDGYAIALEAGGSSEASTDFFLPIYRPLRALQCIQEGKPITRGDIQVEWQMKPFDECRRLGLSSEAEANARKAFPTKIGLLVAEIVLLEGPAAPLEDNYLIKEGDILISINDEPIATHVRVDEILDENVGKELKFTLQRGSGEYFHQLITIGDLHKITPSRYVEVGGACFNDLSYQIARNNCIPVRGVYINDPSGSFELSGSDSGMYMLLSIDDIPTPDLDTFIQVMKTIPDRKRVSICFRDVAGVYGETIQVIYLDRHWNTTFRLSQRNDNTGLWDFTDLLGKDEELPKLPAPEPQNARFIDIPFEEGDAESTTASLAKKGNCSKLSRSFAQVRVIAPIPLDSYSHMKERGYGIVIDAEHGYVLVSRKFVPHDMCDIIITFAESIEVAAEVVFLHPHQNYAIIKYDPLLVLADVRTPEFSEKPLKRGERALFVGYNYHFRLLTDDVKVSAIASYNIPGGLYPARYRGTNLECVVLDTKICQDCDTAIITDYDGKIRSFWLTYMGEEGACENGGDRLYHMGLDVTDVLPIIRGLQQNNKLPMSKSLRILDAEFSAITVSQGRTRGVPMNWISKFEGECEDEIKFFNVSKLIAPPQPLPSKLSKVNQFKIGDIVLSVNDKLVTSMRDLYVMYDQEFLNFKVIREKKELDLVVSTIDTDHLNTSQVVGWCGMILQEPHYAVHQTLTKLPSKVYITTRLPGGPAAAYQVSSYRFITHVNDQETKDLETFLNVVKSIPDNTYVKLRLVYDNIPEALSLKTNYHYFPTGEFKKDNTGKWVEVDHEKISDEKK